MISTSGGLKIQGQSCIAEGTVSQDFPGEKAAKVPLIQLLYKPLQLTERRWLLRTAEKEVRILPALKRKEVTGFCSISSTAQCTRDYFSIGYLCSIDICTEESLE
jgi:hypothetical protein